MNGYTFNAFPCVERLSLKSDLSWNLNSLKTLNIFSVSWTTLQYTRLWSFSNIARFRHHNRSIVATSQLELPRQSSLSSFNRARKEFVDDELLSPLRKLFAQMKCYQTLAIRFLFLWQMFGSMTSWLIFISFIFHCWWGS